MSRSWPTVTLGEVADLNPESTKAIDPSHQIQYIDLSAVSAESGVIRDKVDGYRLDEAPGRARRRVRSGDVLVATVRPYLRGFAVVPPDLDGEVASTGFTVLRAGSGCLPGYLWALVGQQAFVDHLMERATGSNYPAVRPDDIASFPLLLPSIREQRRIVDLLNALEGLIGCANVLARAASEAQIARLRAARDAADDLIDVGDLLRLQYGKALREGDRRPGTVGVFGSAGRVGSHDDACTPIGPVLVVGRKGVHAISSLPLALRDDVLATSLSSYRGLGGAGSVRWSGEPCWVIDTAYWVEPKRDIDPVVLYWLLVMADLPSVTTTTTLPGLNRDAAYAVRVPAPSDRIYAAVREIEALQEVTQQALVTAEAAQNVRESVLAGVLSGSHEIPESYDALLEPV